MSALDKLWARLSGSKSYRETFAGSVVKRFLPQQIRVMRKQRDWSQADLAKQSNLTQGVISRAEDPEYGNLTINTLARIASGFDCAISVQFIPFSRLAGWYESLDDEAALQVPSFKDDSIAPKKTLQLATVVQISRSSSFTTVVNTPTSSSYPLGVVNTVQSNRSVDLLNRSTFTRRTA